MDVLKRIGKFFSKRLLNREIKKTGLNGANRPSNNYAGELTILKLRKLKKRLLFNFLDKKKPKNKSNANILDTFVIHLQNHSRPFSIYFENKKLKARWP